MSAPTIRSRLDAKQDPRLGAGSLDAEHAGAQVPVAGELLGQLPVIKRAARWRHRQRLSPGAHGLGGAPSRHACAPRGGGAQHPSPRQVSAPSWIGERGDRPAPIAGSAHQIPERGVEHQADQDAGGEVGAEHVLDALTGWWAPDPQPRSSIRCLARPSIGISTMPSYGERDPDNPLLAGRSPRDQRTDRVPAGDVRGEQEETDRDELLRAMLSADPEEAGARR